jgi:hypothetical protein
VTRTTEIAVLLLALVCNGCGLLRSGVGGNERPGGENRFADIEVSQADVVRAAAEKVARLREHLKRESLAAAVIGTPGGLAWITSGAEPSGGFSSRRGATLVITSTAKYLVGTRGETTRLLREDLAGQGYQQRVVPWTLDADAQLASLLPAGRLISDVALTSDRPVQRVTSYRTLFWPLTPLDLRRCRWLGRKTAEALGRAAHGVRLGMTELHVASVLRRELAEWDVEPVELLVASGERGQTALGPPRNVAIDEFICIQVEAERWGLHVSAARSVHLGEPGDVELDFRRGAVVAAKVWAATLSAERLGEVARAAQEAYAEAGRPGAWERLALGGPAAYGAQGALATPTSTAPVRDGMTFVWHVGVGRARLADTVLRTEKGIELITRTEDWPTVDVRVGDAEFSVPGLLVR